MAVYRRVIQRQGHLRVSQIPMPALLPGEVACLTPIKAALLLSFGTLEDFRAGSMTLAAKTPEQQGQATKRPVAGLHEMNQLGSSATRLTQHRGWGKPPRVVEREE